MVAAKIREIIAQLVPEGTDFTVERPKQADHGDYASNVALVVAKQLGQNPRELAEKWQAQLQDNPLFSAVSVAGPGFLNFTVASGTWHDVVRQIAAQGAKFGTFPATNQKIQVEFISANPTGPLTLGNGRGGFGGDVLARVLARAGHQVEREYYINDAGNQIVSLGKTLTGEEPLYAGEYIKDLQKKVATSGDSLTVGKAGAEAMLAELQQTVARMNINFDTWFSEQSVYDSGRIEKVLTDLAKAGATFKQDGALWLRTTEHGDDKDRVLRKQDGELTYLAADIAHYYENFVTGGLDHKINILGADHHGYVARMQAAVEMLRQAEGFTGQSTIIITQLVRLIRDGQEVKMSKRAGTYVTLDELLEEIDVDVARFFFVMKSFDTHMDFDFDLAKEQNQKNPVFYLKYAHARIASILREAPEGSGTLARLSDPHELALIRELARFPELIQEIATDYQVHRLPHYALGVADRFHQFYEHCKVISEDAELTTDRVQLLRATQIVLQNIGSSLGITMPEQM